MAMEAPLVNLSLSTDPNPCPRAKNPISLIPEHERLGHTCLQIRNEINEEMMRKMAAYPQHKKAKGASFALEYEQSKADHDMLTELKTLELPKQPHNTEPFPSQPIVVASVKTIYKTMHDQEFDTYAQHHRLSTNSDTKSNYDPIAARASVAMLTSEKFAHQQVTSIAV